MAYAVLQKDPAVLAPDLLQRAFRAVKSLTEADAAKLARGRPYGFLLNHLSAEDAACAQRALEAEGVAAEAVDMGRLPKCPEAKCVRRIEFQPEAFLVYDPLGRAVPVPWQHLVLISAGLVRHYQSTRFETSSYGISMGGHLGVSLEVVPEIGHGVTDSQHLLLEVFLTRGAARFQVEAAGFPFKYVFDRSDLDLTGKFATLVELLCQRAPQARVNRGAQLFREKSRSLVTYPSKAAFSAESEWLLWRMAA